MKRDTVHALSFDVEEHFQVSAFWSDERRSQWDRYESRVERNVDKILTLLSLHGIHATFFVLGWVAGKHPSVVKTIVKEGHEIASHGFGHEMITAQQPGQFRDDIRKSKAILEEIAGCAVHGYRAPSFTITPSTRWALPILVEEGYLYDSSIFPVRHDRYGMPEADPYCHRVQTESGPLWEVPLSTVKVGPMRLPVAGGGYFRLFPYPVLRRLLHSSAAGGHPLVMYLHPWELDPDQPRMEGSRLSKFRHYLNLGKTEGRLRRLLSDFRFATIRNALDAVGTACRDKEHRNGQVKVEDGAGRYAIAGNGND
jgi:polysaccharide deacetylase family protein (PEP-CTERM system associated)